MTDLATLLLRVDSSAVRAASRDLHALRAAGGGVAAGTNAYRQGMVQATTATERMSLSVNRLVGFMGGLGIVLGIRQVIAYADAWTNAGNRLAAAGIATEDLRRVQADLTDLTVETRSSLDSTVALYSRLAAATEELGLNEEQLFGIVRTVNQAMIVGGASTTEASSAVRQLSQAFASGVLRGDEFNSIMENSLPLARAIADEMGVGIGELRALAEEGAITSTIIASGLQNAAVSIQEAFDRTQLTVGQAFQNLGTRFTEFLGGVNDGTGVFSMLADVVSILAENLEALAVVLLLVAARLVLPGLVLFVRNIGVAVASTILWDRAAVGLSIRLTAANVAATLLSRTLAFFGGWIGVAITAVAAGIGLIASRSSGAAEATRTHAAAVQDLADRYELAGGNVRAFSQEVAQSGLITQRIALEAAEEAERAAEFNATRARAYAGMIPLGGASGFDVLSDTEALQASLRQIAAAGNLAVVPLLEAVDALIAARVESQRLRDSIAELEPVAAGVLEPSITPAGPGRGYAEALATLQEYVPVLQEQRNAYRAVIAVETALVEAEQKLSEAVDAGSLSARAYIALYDDLVRVHALARQEISGVGEALRDASSGAEEFIATPIASTLTGLAADLAEIAANAEAARGPLLDMLGGDLLPDQVAKVNDLVAGINAAEAALIVAARAADENARAIDAAADRAAAFASAMTELRGIAAPTLSEAEQLANAFAAAMANAANETDRTAAAVAYLAGQVRMAAGVTAEIEEVIGRMNAQVRPADLSNRLVFGLEAYNQLSDAARAQLEVDEALEQQYNDSVTAAFNSIQAIDAHTASLRSSSSASADAQSDFEKALEALAERTAALDADIAVIGMTAEAEAEYRDALELTRIETELLRAAEEDRRGVSAEERGQIDAAIAAYEAKAAALRALRAEQEAAAERTEKVSNAFSNIMEAVLSFVSGTKTGLDILISVLGKAQDFFMKMAKENLAKGNIGGTILFAGLAIISAIIKRRAEEKKKIEDAAREWAELQEELGEFINKLRGRGGGALVGAMDDARAGAEKFIEAAVKAGKSFDHIIAALAEFNRRAIRDFVNTLPLVMHSLASGLGEDSPALAAAQRVREIGASLRGFIADTERAVKVTGAHAGIIDRVREASVGYAVSLLRQPPVLSDVQEEYLRIIGTARELVGVLEDLGVSAADAARMIEEGTTAALNTLRDKFTRDLTSRLNRALGRGYINDIVGLIAQVKQDLSSARLLGMDQALVMRVFAAEAQAVIDGVGLTGEAFQELIRMFPQLAGVVHEATETMARDMERVNGTARTITEYIRNLRGGAESTRSPADQLAFTQKAYDRMLNLARSGDPGAQADITSYAEDYRRAVREMYASGAEYQRILQEIEAQLLNLPAVQEADDPVVVALRELITATLGIRAAVDGLPAQIAATLLPMFTTLDKDLNGLLSFDELKLGLKGLATDDQIRAMIKAVDLNRDGTISKLELLLSAAGINAAMIVKAINDSPALLAGKLLPFFEMIDLNLDGLLNSEELKLVLGLTNAEVRKLITAVDFNRDGVISKLEMTLGSKGLTPAAIVKALADNPAALAGKLAPFFALLDKDVNGLLNARELQDALGITNEEVMKLIRSVDLNGDNQISKLEMLLGDDGTTPVMLKNAFILAAGEGAYTLAGLLYPHFTNLDKNTDGLLNFTELQEAFKGVATDDQIKAMITKLDTNHDGQISELELLRGSTLGVDDTATDIGETIENMAIYTAEQYLQPMANFLYNIMEYTRVTAENLSHQTATPRTGIFGGFFRRLFGREDGGLIPMMAGGGLIGNGIWGRDSVLAQYAGGGSIGLAGGEYVMPAAQTAANLPGLRAMHRGGAGNDNADLIRAVRETGRAQMQVAVQATQGQVTALREEMAMLRAENRELRKTLERQPVRRPGTVKAA